MPPNDKTTNAGPDRYYCRFTAGRSSSPVDGTATLAISGVEIDLGPGHPKRLWHYDSLKTLEPVRPNAIDVLLSSPGEPGASLFVQGARFAADLTGYAPHLTARAARWRNWKWGLLLAAIIALAVAASFAAGWSPLRSFAAALPDSWRQRLGDTARESMTEGRKQCVDANGVAALSQLAARLSKAAPEGISFNVRVYDWPLMNAFAVPGGQIVLTKGLIDKAESPDEVAGVLAHEMGHGIEMHPETGIIRSVGLAAAVEIMLGGGGLANAGLMLAQLGYSRGAEHEADLDALQLLKGAGIAPKGLGSFFMRVTKMEAENSGGAKSGAFIWLRTHPPAAERAKLVREQPDYPATPALDEQSWEELKSICKTTIEPQKPGNGD
jgi:predicted Zn-dependent protease